VVNHRERSSGFIVGACEDATLLAFFYPSGDSTAVDRHADEDGAHGWDERKRQLRIATDAGMLQSHYKTQNQSIMDIGG
jgi:hypothetical protein